MVSTIVSQILGKHTYAYMQVTCLSFLHPGGLRTGTMFADDEILLAGTSKGALVYIADAENHATREAAYASSSYQKSGLNNGNVENRATRAAAPASSSHKKSNRAPNNGTDDDRIIFKQSIHGDNEHVTICQLNMSKCVIPDLCLMEGVISPKECDQLARFVEEQMAAGRAGKLQGRTYTPIPPNFKWKKQSRELLQYGVYTHSNRIEPAVEVAPLPDVLLQLIEHLRKAGVFTDPRTSSEVGTLLELEFSRIRVRTPFKLFAHFHA